MKEAQKNKLAERVEEKKAQNCWNEHKNSWKEQNDSWKGGKKLKLAHKKLKETRTKELNCTNVMKQNRSSEIIRAKTTNDCESSESIVAPFLEAVRDEGLKNLLTVVTLRVFSFVFFSSNLEKGPREACPGCCCAAADWECAPWLLAYAASSSRCNLDPEESRNETPNINV